MKRNPPLLNLTRLFLMSEEGAKFLLVVAVWRIMWRGGDQRVILKERMMPFKGFLQDFPENCTLDLLGGMCENPADRDRGVWLYRFQNCKVNRSWIPTAGALSPWEKGSLNYWLEIDCEILTKMEEL